MTDMKASIRQRLERNQERYEEVGRTLADPSMDGGSREFRELSMEYARLTPLAGRFAAFRQLEQEFEAARALQDDADPAMREMGREEAQRLAAALESEEQQLRRMLIPRDPRDGHNVYLEVRAGTGGDEAAIFAGDLLRMYARYAERQRWPVEILSESPGEVGGFKEIICRISGHGVYSRLKFESGGHRVQRVPETESQGRIHTSACTVAVMHEADERAAVEINPADLRIDTFRASGAGGQHINKTDSAVRITHLPTGIVVECQDGRSQHQNKAQALRVLAARIQDAQDREAHAQEASTRKSLVGSGDRSDRIRTYNFPQGRITDHRINLTLYKIDAIMDGDLDDLFAALLSEHQAEQLATLSEAGH